MFEVKESSPSPFTVSSFKQAKAVDLGISHASTGNPPGGHSDIQVLRAGLTSDEAIDREIDALMAHLERVRREAKKLLAVLNSAT